MALNTELLITLQQVRGIGNKTILKLAKQVSAKDIEELCDMWPTLADKRLQKVSKEDLFAANRNAYKIIEASENAGIGIISYFEDAFPEILRGCTDEDGKNNPPLVLYYRGNLKALDAPGIAVIGTREPTATGVNAGHYFSEELARHGFNIVSGLAVGCDTAGHEGALAAGGLTTAFLANGLSWENIYPQENQDLARRIVEKGGLLLSEYPIGHQGGRYNFIERDRLQAGLAYATLVVQTGPKGGTMHAVRATIQARKPLYAVQFNRQEDLLAPKTQGNIKLLNDGAAKPFCTKDMPAIIKSLKGLAEKKVKESFQRNLFDFD